MKKPRLQGSLCLLLKCRAEQIPLLDSSIHLVIATPPYCGAGRNSQQDWCTKNSEKYDALLARFVEEASRIVKPGGHILVHTNKPPVQKAQGVPQIVFKVLRRPVRGVRQVPKWVKAETFTTRYTHVEGMKWMALPVCVYRALIRRYTNPGETVVHAFSGSGNGALAALGLSRMPILLDLHHHRQVLRRLSKGLTRKHYGQFTHEAYRN